MEKPEAGYYTGYQDREAATSGWEKNYLGHLGPSMGNAPHGAQEQSVDLEFQGQGLGGALLADALDRAARSEIAAHALVMDATNEMAVVFHHGFIALPDSSHVLFLPLATWVNNNK